MKKFLSFIIATILLTGCVSLQKREEQKELMRKAVSEALKKRQMYIDVRTMHPMRYTSKTITSNYSLEVRGDTVRSYLPYIGVAHQAPMSSNPQVLNFVERILSYKESHPKANLTRIEMSLKTSEDNYEYIVELYDTGEAYIDVRPQNSDLISFDGELDPEQSFKDQ